jgi:RecB family endonuclease NucS
MATSIKCWSVKKDAPPHEAELGAPELERHLEDWIEECIDLVDSSLLVIGRQVENIDLLTIDDEGQPVVIELKRDQLPRAVLAQALDSVDPIFKV